MFISKEELGSIWYTFLLQCDPYWPRTFALSHLIDQVNCGISIIPKHPARFELLILSKMAAIWIHSYMNAVTWYSHEYNQYGHMNTAKKRVQPYENVHMNTAIFGRFHIAYENSHMKTVIWIQWIWILWGLPAEHFCLSLTEVVITHSSPHSLVTHLVVFVYEGVWEWHHDRTT